MKRYAKYSCGDDVHFRCGRCHCDIESGAKMFLNMWICPDCFRQFTPIMRAYLEGRKVSFQADLCSA